MTAYSFEIAACCLITLLKRNLFKQAGKLSTLETAFSSGLQKAASVAWKSSCQKKHSGLQWMAKDKWKRLHRLVSKVHCGLLHAWLQIY